MKNIKFKTFQKISLPKRLLNWICGRGFSKYHFPEINTQTSLIMASNKEIYEGDILKDGFIVGHCHEEKGM
jgi:hypothetical protein